MTQVDRSRLCAGDLVQVTVVATSDQDRLSHGHIADQLHDLVLTVPTPASVALWGPWGSGKSGVANLLREHVAREAGVRFVRFDAFKYAENPLRRNFISAVAGALGIKDARFHDDLYGGRVTARIEFGRREMKQLLATFAQMFTLVVGVFALVMMALAFVRGGPVRETFASTASEALKAGIAPAALLTSLAVLVSRTLTREHRIDAAQSDEQFETLFRELVSRSKVKRLVVFVDELDRCAPADVVATLDAMRNPALHSRATVPFRVKAPTAPGGQAFRPE